MPPVQDVLKALLDQFRSSLTKDLPVVDDVRARSLYTVSLNAPIEPR